MTYSRFCRLRVLLPVLLISAAPVALPAQTTTPEMAGRALSDHLNTLSTSPQNLRALLGAGEAALELDDPNGAIGFFGRVEEIDPRNPRAKAGFGRALLMLEKPRDALRLFDLAVDYGMSEARIAGDRGLAYDLRGDQRRAQRDYALALKQENDPEVVRRLALSHAISGERDQALKLIEPLLYKQDKAAWRVRAFILALSGDTEQANNVARQVMPGNLARPMAPFFAKLPGLTPAQKAAAVHFGHMPSDGRSGGLLYAQNDAAPTSPAPPARTTAPAAAQTRVTGRERTSRGRGSLASVTAAQQNARLAASETPSGAPPAPVLKADTQGVLMARPGAKPSPAATAAASSRLAAIVGSLELETPVIVAPPRPASAREANAVAAAQEARPAAVPPKPVEAKPAPKPAAKPAAKPTDPKPDAKKPPVKKAPEKPAEKKPKVDPKKAEPARLWAQILTGADKAALARDYDRLVKKAPVAFKGKGVWTADYGKSNRLLIGPFATAKAARDFLDNAKVDGFVWSSAAGEAVEKFPAK
ncbi:tetratricopeptide repeat protein [Sphingomonas sp. C3-2]|uniref:tetratricopeptide repeat protein n=1 Tax=Sphingomonas sp. C3-2 TaxID=3062169 RepID=UPI00294AB66F|nr:SPOR domain-containing protein [Sphingomonas sp. C3-2]WOK35707.1 SPOR domain-containing protein [Sphingomonas sp. C3-2]